jgi:hypothetical protein
VRRAALALALALVPVVDASGQTPAARAPVALVVELTGGGIPGVEPFREIPGGTTVNVPAGVRLVFHHYASCRKFTMTGGTAVIRADGVDITGSRASDVKTACLRKLSLKEEGANAAMVMRTSGLGRTVISTRPDFVIVGPRLAELAGLRVRKGDDVVLEQRLATGPRVPWPAGATPLTPGTGYEIDLVPANPEARPLVVRVRTLDVATPDDTLTLLSAE